MMLHATCMSSSRIFFYFLRLHSFFSLLFFFNDPAPTEIYTLSLHDALPISCARTGRRSGPGARGARRGSRAGARHPHSRSEEHTSELQSLRHLVCRLLLEKKKKNKKKKNRQQIIQTKKEQHSKHNRNMTHNL